MLSAFTARPIIELKQRDKSKIETILAYGDRVLVGLNTGALRVYRLNELPASTPSSSQGPSPSNGTSSLSESQSVSQPASQPGNPLPEPQSSSSPATRPTDLLREVEKFSTRAIEQLAIIKEANTLVSLSNYSVSLHDLQTYELIETIPRIKNATCFAVTSNIVKDAATGIPEIISRLAVAAKRRLLVWSWHESELHEKVTEIVLPEAIRTVTWASAIKVVCGMNAGYVLVDVTTSETHEIAGVGAAVAGGQGSRFGAASMGYMGLGSFVPKPLAARLAEGEMLLTKDINSLFIDAEGKPLEKRQIPWQYAPESIGYSYPYILALQPPAKGSLEVRNPETLNLLQTIELAGAAQLHFPPPTVSLAHAGKGFHISSDRVVWKMDATDYDTQVQELIAKAQYDEAISVLSMLEDALLKDKVGTMREVKMLKAEALFKQRKFRQSLDLFNEDEVHAPPERVLRLYPRIIAGELSTETEEEETGDEEGQACTEEESGANGDKEGKADGVPDITSSHKAGGAGAFAKYWMGSGHRKMDSDATSIASSKFGGADDDAASIKPKFKRAETAGPLEGKELAKAVRELNSFLAGTRARLQRVIDPETGKLRPRKAAMGLTHSSSTDENLDALLTSRRSESDEQLEQELRRTFTLVDTTLFRGYMFCQPSLAPSLFRIPNFCNPSVVNEKLLEHNRYNELVDFFFGKKLHRDALTLLRKFGDLPPDEDGETTTTLEVNGHGETKVEIPEQLRGPQRTVGYLQSLPPEMADLILEFAEWVLRRNADLGMEIFLADSENAETLPRDKVVSFLAAIDVALETKYLEHIIDELGDATPEFHNRLVELLVDTLKQNESRDDRWESRLQKLVEFLKESRQYSLSRAFAMIPREDSAFYEAQAVVLSNMGNHKQALEIYVFKMQDYMRAEEYCNRIHSQASEQQQQQHKSQDASIVDQDDPDAITSIYHTLLSLYLTPPPPHKPNLEPALSLLSRHGSRLPATSTLSLIPDTLPVTKLESYFRGRMRAANSVVSESRIVESLRKTQLVNTQALLLLGDGLPGGQGGRNRRVVISEERVCGVCHKRLGNSVVAVQPDNSVVHYGCLGKGRSTSNTRSERIAGSWGRHG